MQDQAVRWKDFPETGDIRAEQGSPAERDLADLFEARRIRQRCDQAPQHSHRGVQEGDASRVDPVRQVCSAVGFQIEREERRAAEQCAKQVRTRGAETV